MNIFKKLKLYLDKKIEKDKTINANLEPETISLKSILNGRILLNRNFRKLIPMIFLILIISIIFINNRFEYEALVRQNNELKDERIDLQTTWLIKMRQFKHLSTRSAISERLHEINSEVGEAETPPITID